MRIRPSTFIIAAVTVVYVVFLVLEFAGIVGNDAGRLQPGLVVMLILLMGLLFADLRRYRTRSGTDL